MIPSSPVNHPASSSWAGATGSCILGLVPSLLLHLMYTSNDGGQYCMDVSGEAIHWSWPNVVFPMRVEWSGRLP